jgi:hypothetical protein
MTTLASILSRVEDPDPHYFRMLDPDPALEGKAGSGSALESKFKSFRGSK